MSFLNEVHEAARRPGPPCSFQQFQLDDADQADLTRVLGDVSIRSSAIAKALQARGIPIRAQTVQRHRLGECSCP